MDFISKRRIISILLGSGKNLDWLALLLIKVAVAAEIDMLEVLRL